MAWIATVGGVVGALGGVAGSLLSADSAGKATQMQTDALNKQRQFVFQNLDPSVVGSQATQADFANAVNRLVVQGKLDPALLDARYGAEGSISDQLKALGQTPGKVSDQAVLEALNPTPGAAQGRAALTAAGNADLAAPTAGKDQLISAAMDELKAGATLPPDVQAELVKAGLENSGMVTQNSSGQGVGGQILRTILGTAGIQLQQQRQQQATGLLSAAQALDTQRKQTAAGLLTSSQNLEQARASILQNLFPSLASTQLSTLAGTQGVLNQSNSMLPNAGLSGTDVANLWLARVGATNQLAQSAANAAAQGTIAQGVAYGNLAGSAAKGVGSIVNGWLSPASKSPTPAVNPNDWSNPANYT